MWCESLNDIKIETRSERKTQNSQYTFESSVSHRSSQRQKKEKQREILIQMKLELYMEISKRNIILPEFISSRNNTPAGFLISNG